jgi:hypothetical protein
MKRNLQKNYYWKQLTEEGLLVSPKNRYGDTVFTSYCGFPDKETAVKEYERMKGIYSELLEELVLIEVYEFVTDWD